MGELWRAIRARRLDYLFLFVGFFAIAVYIQYNQVMGDPDGFYHAAMAQFLSRGVILKDMPWMQATTLRMYFTDHHLLYHALLIPFVILGNPLLGVKLATAAFGAAFFVTLYGTLRRLRFAGPLLATLTLFFSSGFLFRLSLVKANSVSLILLLCILICLFERRWWLLAMLNTIFVWLYGGWIVAWVAAFVYSFVAFWYWVFLARGFRRHRFLSRLRGLRRIPMLKPVLATVGGSLVGLIVNPYWPHNVRFYWQQIWQIAIVNQGSVVNVGGEWSSLSPYEFVNNLGLTAIAGALLCTLIILEVRRITFRTWVLFALTLLFSVFMYKSRRYIELAAPSMIIAASSAWADVFQYHIFEHLWRSWHMHRRMKQNLTIVALVVIAMLVALPRAGLWGRIEQVRAEVAQGIPLHQYQKVSNWLAQNTLPETIVLQSDWDDWPMLFYYNQRNYYLVGLDPTFMYNYSPKLYAEWADLTANGSTDNLVQVVDQDFHARYVLVDKDHAAFQKTVASNIYFRLVYEDDEVWLYRYTPAQAL